DLVDFLFRQPPVHSAALLDPRIDGGGRNVPDRRSDQANSLPKEPPVAGKGQRESMKAERRRTITGTAIQSGVVPDWPGGGEHYQGQVLFGTDQGGIVCDQLLCQAGQFGVAHRLGNPSSLATAPKSPQVVVQPKQPMAKGSTQIGD